jgi:glutamate carboxypeptidase
MTAELEAKVLGWLDGQREAMTALLADIVNIDSGSYNKAGVDAVGARLEAYLNGVGIETERVANETYGDAIRAPLDAAPGGGNAPIVLMGHRDTVFPDGAVAERPFTTDASGDIAYGPGVADMKSGLVMNTFVLEAFKRAGGAPSPLLGLYTSDEEIASPSSRPIIEDEARRARAVFNAEPGRESGNVVTARKGASFFKFEIIGKAAHSGGRFELGISAIESMARKIQALHRLTDLERGVTVNVGLISGGQTVNTVAPHCSAEVDVRFKTMEDREWAWTRIREVLEEVHLEGTETRIVTERGFLPMTMSAESRALFDVYVSGAAEVGLTIDGEFSGGSADSGFTAQVGTPTVCSTGPVGGAAHTPEEFCRLDTMVPRAKAVALAIIRMGA